uniref:Uncharacterized protein n=1 Tax=Amphimedon queenslandica TaxID=400682 RepID=A0A1X7TWJ5_AMPQE
MRLKNNMDATGFFPDEESGSLRGLTPWQTFLVEGSPVPVTNAIVTANRTVPKATPGASRTITPSAVSPGTSSTSYSPNFCFLAKRQSLTPTTAGAKVTVVKAIVEWGDKPHFNKLQEILIEVDESIAIVSI